MKEFIAVWGPGLVGVQRLWRSLQPHDSGTEFIVVGGQAQSECCVCGGAYSPMTQRRADSGVRHRPGVPSPSERAGQEAPALRHARHAAAAQQARSQGSAATAAQQLLARQSTQPLL